MTRASAKAPVVFLGPSLGAAQARGLGRLELRPPARRGDIWRAVEAGAKVIALIDGLFERVPPVWHRELVDALDSGVAVLGASSMGALRAAELERFGMIGVGTIAGWYARGACVDDGDVALVHADAEHGYRALSVPLVNVRWNLERARAAGVLTGPQARRLLEAGAAIFYPDRLWPEVIAAAPLPPAVRRRFAAWLAAHGEDLKALDAQACLRVALELSRRWEGAPARTRRAGFSSLVRRTRLVEGVSAGPGGSVCASEVLAALDDDAPALTEAGLRRALLAAWAREQGLGALASRDALDRWAESWRAGIGESSLDAALSRSGLTRAELDGLLEDVVLESALLRHPSRVTSDGPSALEAFASQARLTGAWAGVVRRRRSPRNPPR